MTWFKRVLFQQTRQQRHSASWITFYCSLVYKLCGLTFNSCSHRPSALRYHLLRYLVLGELSDSPALHFKWGFMSCLKIFVSLVSQALSFWAYDAIFWRIVAQGRKEGKKGARREREMGREANGKVEGELRAEARQSECTHRSSCSRQMLWKQTSSMWIICE